MTDERKPAKNQDAGRDPVDTLRDELVCMDLLEAEPMD